MKLRLDNTPAPPRKLFRAAHFVAAAGLLATSGAAQSAEPSNSVPGSLGESVRVSPGGAFTYQIPIAVPPGIGGVQPNLSLNYNSQGGNGIVGMGWSLSGLASIERTPRIRAIDGVNGAVAYDDDDRYALQGERLIVISGANGASGSTYRTETESWRRVVANGRLGNGPESFTVTTRAGVEMTFGDSPDSAPKAGDLADVQSWCLHTMTDLHGNTMTVTYTDDPLQSGESDYRCYPSRIDYTTNTGAGQTANRSVQFHYDPRIDPDTGLSDTPVTYRGGAPLGLTARLGNIRTYVGDNIVSDYALNYENSLSTERSLLTAVTRKASDAADATLLSPTTFTYSESGRAFTPMADWLTGEFGSNAGYAEGSVTLADVDGDGFSDIVGFHYDGVHVALGSATGFQTSTPWIDDSESWSQCEPMLLADVDGDGLADLVGFSSSGVKTAISTGSAFDYKGILEDFSSSDGWDANSTRMLSDANGDERMDIMGVKGGIVSVALGQDEGTFADKTTWLTNFGIASDIYQVGDMNGDGNADVINLDSSTLATTVALSTGEAFTTAGWAGQGEATLCQGTPGPDTPVFLSDANGDGLEDFIAFCSAQPTGAFVSISTGKNLLESSPWDPSFAGSSWRVGDQRQAADLNGDGKVDLVHVSGSDVTAHLSTGDGFEPGNWDENSLDWGLSADPTSTRFMVDANADGLMDMVGIGGSNVNVSTSAGPYPDLLTEAVRSAGATYTVTYAPLSDSDVYRESSPQGLAQFQKFPPLDSASGSLPQLRSAARLGGNYHVVQALSVDDNPAVGDLSFHYASTFFYEDGLLDLDGRGWLGFARVTEDSQTGGRRLVREYRQDFPFIGMLAQGQLLDQKDLGCAGQPTPYTSARLGYEQQQSATASDGSNAPVYFPYLARRFAGAYSECELINRIGTHLSYDDGYGNLTSVSRLGLVDANGEDLDANDNVYFLTQYSNDAMAWQLGYPEYKKISASSSTANLDTFADGVDLSLRSWTYNNERNPLTREAWDDGNNSFIGFAYTYNDFGLEHTRTSPAGSVRTTTYEPTYNTYPNEIVQTTSATTSLAYTYGYDPRFGVQSVAVDPNNVSQITCFDDFGRRVAQQGLYPDARSAGSFDAVCVSPLLAGASAPENVVTVRQLQYGWQGELPTVTAELLSDWPIDDTRSTFSLRRTWDGLWRKSTAVVGDGDDSVVMSEQAYAERGHVVRSALPYAAGELAKYATTQYDVIGRPIQTEVPTGLTGDDSLVNTFVYAATSTGATTHQKTAPDTDDEIEQILTYGFAANRPRIMNSATDGLPGSTDYAYDLQGRGWSLTAPAGQDGSRPQWTRTTDSLGRTVVSTSPGRGTITSQYDETGLLHSRTQDSGSFRYTHDLLGRLEVAEGSDGIKQHWTWDGPANVFGQGRLASGEVATLGKHSEVINHTDYTYDATGSIDTQTLTLALAPDPYPVTQSYDPQGRMIGVIHPDGSQMNHTYDGIRLSSVDLEDASVGFSDYAPTGMPRTYTYGNGTTLTSTFAVDGQLLSQLVEDPNDDTLLSRNYQWDDAQRLAWIDDDTNGDPTRTWTYAYNANRLVDATADGGQSWSEQYDGSGNLTQYGDLSYEYTGTLATSGDGDNGFTAKYGRMGSMRKLQVGDGPTYRFAHDASNRTIAAKASGSREGSAYEYDHTGRMVAAVLPDQVTVYVAPSYWDVRSNGQSSPLRMLQSFGQVQAQWGTEVGDGSRFYVHTDHQLSTLMTSGASGQPLTRLAYTPQGAIRDGDPGALRFTYTGLEQDAFTGFYRMGFRQYHPGIARFNRPDDRLGGPATLGDSANDMAYVLNSPAMYRDPTGHAASNWVCFTIAAGGASATAAGYFTNKEAVTITSSVLTFAGFIGCSAYQDGKEMARDVQDRWQQLNRGDANAGEEEALLSPQAPNPDELVIAVNDAVPREVPEVASAAKEAENAEIVGDALEDAAKDSGQAIKNNAREVADGAEEGAEDAGEALGEVAVDAGENF